MKKMGLALLLVLIASLTAASWALAQGEELALKLSRDWGYGGLSGDIQGTFSMRASGPGNLTRVEFFIDDSKIGEATSAPFNLQFVTDNYPAGAHSMSAVGYTTDGGELRSQAIRATFVSKEEGGKAAMGIIVPLLGIIAGAMILSFLVSMISGRKVKTLPPGTPRQYPLGGGICRSCGRPVALQVFGINAVAGKLQRCPFCGRWSVFRRVSLEQLRAAERAELGAAKLGQPEVAEEEKLRKELDDSKYQGL
ncbi:MAG TPA: Ig-like domain-containing protein [Anaerolineae bacterium]|nr:Ig-like domain-containing protein [Anaerolineae bacterium]